MPVRIDEITAIVQPDAPAADASSTRDREGTVSSAVLAATLASVREELARRAVRAARLRAD